VLNTFVVMAAAWLEIVVGTSFIMIPDFPCRLLFAATPEGLAISLARFAGIALLGLGIACLPSKIAGSHRGTVRGLLVFNLGATIFFAWVAIATSLRGPVLWPVVILHVVIATALLPQFLNKSSTAR
jgi:hypothetical protein